MKAARSILKDVSFAYVRRYLRYEQAVARGDYDVADDALSGVLDIEKSVTVIENNRAWREGREHGRT